MESQATTVCVPVCRLNLLTSAARLAWLVCTPANNVKRNAALHLISTHLGDSALPPHAPLTVLAASLGLQPSQLLSVLSPDDMFGVLGHHDTSCTSVVYLNAETLITRVYKDTGACVPALQPNGAGSMNKLGKRAATQDSRQDCYHTATGRSTASSAPARGINKQGRIYTADGPRHTSCMQPLACVTAQPTLSVAQPVAVGSVASQAAAAQVQQYLRLLALQAQQQLCGKTYCRMTASPTENHHDGTVGSDHNTSARDTMTIDATSASTVASDDVKKSPVTMLLLNEGLGTELADIFDSHTSDVLQKCVMPRSVGMRCSSLGKLSAPKQLLNDLALKFSADPPVSPPHHRGQVSAVSDLAGADQQHTSRAAPTSQLPPARR